MTQLVQNVPEKMLSTLQWQSPAGDLSITLEAGIVERLKHEVIAAFRSLPKRGMEVGGILLGRVERGRQRSIIVEQVEPIPCEHRSGPAFILSDSDRGRLASQLTQPRDDDFEVLGYYRSCTGREISLDEADREIIEEFWPGPDQVFLIIQPISVHECVAAFLFRRNGVLQTKPDHAPFAFRTGPPITAVAEAPEPLPQEPPHAALPLESVAATDPVHSVELRDAEPLRQWEPAPRRRSIVGETDEAEPRRRITHWALACLMLAVVLLAGREAWVFLTEPQWRQLGLNVVPTGSGLEVSWDSSIPEVRNARWGVLTIADNGSESEIELNRAALARGTFTYRRSGDNVLVRLRVTGERNGVIGETFRFVSESNPPPASVPPATAAPAEVAKEDAAKEDNKASQVAAAAPALPKQEPAVEPESPEARSPEPQLNTEVPIAVPARAVREVQPVISEGIRARIHTQIVMPVTVWISASGQVVSATPPAHGDGLYRYLGARAAEAAKLWRFRPALSSDRTPAPSRKTLHFAFAPRPRRF